MKDLIKRRFVDSILYYCPSCDQEAGSVEYVYTLADKKYNIYKCSRCHFMFLRPFILTQLSSRQMDTVDDAEMFNNNWLKKLYINFVLKREVYYTKKSLDPKKSKVLDVGCGTGWSTKLWVDEGFHATGLEPSAARAKLGQERYGLRIIPSYLETMKSDDHYDVILLRHVLEHFENPFEMLSKVRSLLNSNGLVLIVVPNINNLGRFIFGSNWSWILPYHCNFFTPKSLAAMVKRCDLEIVHLYQTPSPLFYPESIFRLFSSLGYSSKIYQKLNSLWLIPFLPLVAAGYFCGWSENITIIARRR